MADLRCVVTDFYFDDSEGDKATGLTFAVSLRGRWNGPIILSSDGEFGVAITEAFDAVLPKDPPERDVLMGIMAKAKGKQTL